jgi:hypothetical protein
LRLWPGEHVTLPFAGGADELLARLRAALQPDETSAGGTSLVGSVAGSVVYARLHSPGAFGTSPAFQGRVDAARSAVAGRVTMSDDTVLRMVAIDVGALFVLGALVLARLSWDPAGIRTVEWVVIGAAVPLVFWLSAWLDWRLGAPRRREFVERLAAICGGRGKQLP